MKKFVEGLFSKRLNEKGQEIPDPTPMAPPVGFKRQPSLSEQIRQMILSEKLRQEAEEMGYETFEEADDFDVDDDFDPSTPYEEVFDPQPQPAPAPVEPESPAQPKEASSEPKVEAPSALDQ